jgi:hypothetical protein
MQMILRLNLQMVLAARKDATTTCIYYLPFGQQNVASDSGEEKVGLTRPDILLLLLQFAHDSQVSIPK